MKSLLSISLALLAAIVPEISARSAGCGKSPVASGTKSMTVNGKSRQYILQVPANYNPQTAYKLIFGFHWLNGNFNNVAPNYYGLRSLAQETAIFVAPNGLNSGWANSGGEDVTFTDQMVSTIMNDLCVDESQIFSTGFSYGGGMSYSLACSRANVFRSVAVIAGAQLSGCSGGNTPIPYLGIHGVSDNVLAISQGRSLRDKFLGLNGCASQNAPEPASGSSQRIKTVYSCRAGYPVTWIAHGGGHVGDPNTNGEYWAPGETWNFWAALPSNQTNPTTTASVSTPGPTSITTLTSVSSMTSVTSNPPVTTTPSANCSPRWGQCGGQGWTGPTCCQSGTTCQVSNPWYSQCL